MPGSRIVVRGRVQGVGFRHFTTQTANYMDVRGRVWNRSDGAVEIHAEHPDESVLQAFTEAVERGPGLVRDLLVEPAAEHGYLDFDVSPTR